MTGIAFDKAFQAVYILSFRMWQGRLPEACKAEYPADEHWRCYFGYRLYKTLKSRFPS